MTVLIPFDTKLTNDKKNSITRHAECKAFGSVNEQDILKKKVT